MLVQTTVLKSLSTTTTTNSDDSSAAYVTCKHIACKDAEGETRRVGLREIRAPASQDYHM